jgi:hypothetical protein
MLEAIFGVRYRTMVLGLKSDRQHFRQVGVSPKLMAQSLC